MYIRWQIELLTHLQVGFPDGSFYLFSCTCMGFSDTILMTLFDLVAVLDVMCELVQW